MRARDVKGKKFFFLFFFLSVLAAFPAAPAQAFTIHNDTPFPVSGMLCSPLWGTPIFLFSLEPDQTAHWQKPYTGHGVRGPRPALARPGRGPRARHPAPGHPGPPGGGRRGAGEIRAASGPLAYRLTHSAGASSLRRSLKLMCAGNTVSSGLAQSGDMPTATAR